jgi:hypothetical protein
MHDMDRTRAELEGGIDALEGTGFEFEQESFGEFGQGETYGEFGQGETYGEYGQGETYGENEQELLGETAQGEAPLNELQEMELAAELLEIANEQELNQFIGKLIRTVGRAAGKVVRGPIGQALGPVLKQAARTLLPAAGAALGNLVVPGIGGAVGGKLASAAGKAFGLELEGLSGEDREFEVARRYVRFAGATTRNALRLPPRVPPPRAARLAARTAARRHAPGLARAPWLVGGGPQVNVNANGGYGGADPSQGGWGDGASDDGAGGYGQQGTNGSTAYGTGARSGRWFRRGRRIILVGL